MGSSFTLSLKIHTHLVYRGSLAKVAWALKRSGLKRHLESLAKLRCELRFAQGLEAKNQGSAHV